MRWRTIAACVALAASACAPGCSEAGADAPSAPGGRRLTIAAASSVAPAMEEVARAFEAAHPDVIVTLTAGSSGAFYGQIANGAPFDLFYSADAGYPRALAERGLAFPGSERTYARGRLVLWSSRGSGFDPAEGLGGLSSDRVKRVAIANPSLAPYGRAAVAALRSAGVYEHVAPKLVQGENVGQTAHFALSGAAEVALIPLSLARLPAMADGGTCSEIAADLHEPIEHAVVVTAGSAAPETALAFDAFVAGPIGARILWEHGFARGD